MKKWTKLMAVALSLVIIASAIAGGVVLADEPADSGQVAPPPQRGGMMPGTGVLTDLLGLTAEEIHDQRLAGASLAQIAATQGIGEAELVAALTANVADRLAQQVTDGKLTQEQADEILAKVVAHTTETVNNTGTEPRQTSPRLGTSRTDGRFNTQNRQMPNFGGRSRGFEGGVPSDIAA